MLSNSSIFSSTSELFNFLEAIRAKLIPELNIVANNDYISMNRILQTHSIIYLGGFALILILYITSFLLGGILTRCIRCFCCFCCMESRAEYKAAYATSFSGNIYKEIHCEDLKSEYVKAKQDYGDYNRLI